MKINVWFGFFSSTGAVVSTFSFSAAGFFFSGFQVQQPEHGQVFEQAPLLTELLFSTFGIKSFPGLSCQQVLLPVFNLCLNVYR